MLGYVYYANSTPPNQASLIVLSTHTFDLDINSIL
jgi:hypothetical protein